MSQTNKVPKVTAFPGSGNTKLRGFFIGTDGNIFAQTSHRNYTEDIQIYHFHSYHTSLKNFATSLYHERTGYVATLKSPDPLIGIKVPAGDEVPAGCLEAVYVPNILTGGGCALGFRTDGVMEWYCFDREIHEEPFFNVELPSRSVGLSNETLRLFDRVASLSKDCKPRASRGGNSEHKLLCDTLECAELVGPPRLRIKWKSFGTELEAIHTALRQENDKVQAVEPVGQRTIYESGSEHDKHDGEGDEDKERLNTGAGTDSAEDEAYWGSFW